MLIKAKYISEIDYYFIALAYILFPINWAIVSSVRPVDLIIILHFIYRAFHKNKYFDKSYFFLTMSLIVFIMLSILYGLMFREITNFSNIFFIQKYLFPFILFFNVKNSNLSKAQINDLFRVFVIVLFFMITWTLLYQPLRFLNIIQGSWRTTYPFSNMVEGSDAHMLSSYFSFHATLLFYIWKKDLLKIKVLHFTILLSLILISMLLTGSRNGIVSFILSIMLISILNINIDISVVQKKTIIFTLFVFVILSFLLLFAISLDSEFLSGETGIRSILKRAINFDLTSDDSSNYRLLKFQYAFDEVYNGIVFIGIGAITSKMGWFDGIIPSLLVNSGYLGLTTVFLILVYSCYKNLKLSLLHNRKIYFHLFIVLLLNYSISNLITEFVLVTRGMVFAISVFALIEKIIINDDFELLLVKSS